MRIMYWSIGKDKEFSTLLVLWVGGTERAVATTLVIWAPATLSGFIAGWMALKIAANWGRQQGEKFGKRHLIALVGSTLSFSVAIAVGLAVHPEALATFQGVAVANSG